MKIIRCTAFAALTRDPGKEYEWWVHMQIKEASNVQQRWTFARGGDVEQKRTEKASILAPNGCAAPHNAAPYALLAPGCPEAVLCDACCVVRLGRADDASAGLRVPGDAGACSA